MDLTSSEGDKDLAAAKAEARLRRIENDVLFDKFTAEQEWRKQRVAVERAIAETKKQTKDNETAETEPETASNQSDQKEPEDEISEEAQRIAAEILAENDEGGDLGGLFDSLPQSEVDPSTGESRTVVTSSNGNKVFVRDFGKWTGVSPRRALEEACRSRYVRRRDRLSFRHG